MRVKSAFKTDYSAAMAKADCCSWIIWRISHTHLAHCGAHWWLAKMSFGRLAPAAMARATSRWRRALQLQTYKASHPAHREWLAIALIKAGANHSHAHATLTAPTPTGRARPWLVNRKFPPVRLAGCT